jgi:hypothetical protein
MAFLFLLKNGRFFSSIIIAAGGIFHQSERGAK